MNANDEPEMRAVHVLISGRVQGAGYRAWCADKARALELFGWVRNLRSGEVEAVFSGRSESVEAMLAAAFEGPGWARVFGVRMLGEAGLVGGAFEVCRSE
ncbi:acylphosphatase [Breoghania sp.]|uniref:acylphosphatase n=1 Tax=Breoghania sp. TaxID=2065378 RepID=UPI00262D8D0E|nr:acylphosphatase [Breoghania sp.]MDJ0929916.1 acylphosphatase [Breoghania sp.]